MAAVDVMEDNPLLKSIEGMVDTTIPERFTLQLYTPLPEGQTLDSCDPSSYAPQFVQPSVSEVREQLETDKAEAIEASSKLLGPDAERDPLERISHDERYDAKKERKQGKTKVNAGKNWYNLPATKMTPEILAQMQLIHMRKFVQSYCFFLVFCCVFHFLFLFCFSFIVFLIQLVLIGR